MYLLIIDNSGEDNKEFIVKKLSRPYNESVREILRDTEIAWMIINSFIREYDDDPNGYYIDENLNFPKYDLFQKSLENAEFYNKVCEKLEHIIDNYANFISIDSIETIK